MSLCPLFRCTVIWRSATKIKNKNFICMFHLDQTIKICYSCSGAESWTIWSHFKVPSFSVCCCFSKSENIVTACVSEKVFKINNVKLLKCEEVFFFGFFFLKGKDPWILIWKLIGKSLQIRRQNITWQETTLSAVDMNLESIGYRGVAEPGHTWQPAGKHLALWITNKNIWTASE